MRATVERLVLLAFAAALALLGLTAVAAHRAYEAALREAASAHAAGSAMASVSALRAAVLAAESSSRGFVATGDAAFLEPLEEARQRARHEIEGLGATLGDPVEVDIVRRLDERVSDRLERTESLIATRRDGGRDEAIAKMGTRQGLEMTAGIMDLCDELDLLVEARRSASLQRAAERSLASSHTALASLVAGLLLSALTLVLLRARLASARHEREVAERIAQLVGASEEAIIGKALDGTVLSWNSGAERLYGYSSGEMLGAPIERIIPPERRPETHAVVARVLAGESVPPLETERQCKDGSRVHVSVSLAPVRGPDGSVVAIASVARDATASRQAASDREALIGELRQAAERWRVLQGMLPTCAWCKAIRDESGAWQPIERFLAQRAPLEFTHGICPGCTSRLKGDANAPAARGRVTP